MTISPQGGGGSPPVSFFSQNLPGHQNTGKCTIHTLNIDVRPPTFIFVCIILRDIQFLWHFLGWISNFSHLRKEFDQNGKCSERSEMNICINLTFSDDKCRGFPLIMFSYPSPNTNTVFTAVFYFYSSLDLPNVSNHPDCSQPLSLQLGQEREHPALPLAMFHSLNIFAFRSSDKLWTIHFQCQQSSKFFGRTGR